MGPSAQHHQNIAENALFDVNVALGIDKIPDAPLLFMLDKFLKYNHTLYDKLILRMTRISIMI